MEVLPSAYPQDLAALKTELRSLETERFNPLTAIAPYMPALVNRIAQEARQVWFVNVSDRCLERRFQMRSFGFGRGLGLSDRSSLPSLPLLRLASMYPF